MLTNVSQQVTACSGAPIHREVTTAHVTSTLNQIQQTGESALVGDIYVTLVYQRLSHFEDFACLGRCTGT